MAFKFDGKELNLETPDISKPTNNWAKQCLEAYQTSKKVDVAGTKKIQSTLEKVQQILKDYSKPYTPHSLLGKNNLYSKDQILGVGYYEQLKDSYWKQPVPECLFGQTYFNIITGKVEQQKLYPGDPIKPVYGMWIINFPIPDKALSYKTTIKLNGDTKSWEVLVDGYPEYTYVFAISEAIWPQVALQDVIRKLQED